MTPTSERYVLGHSEHELGRLVSHASFLEPITRSFLQEAGIEPGMRVLDVGSGAGDVAFLAAQLVGPTGFVMGVDRAAPAVELARRRTEEQALRHVAFRQGDPAEMRFDAPFDALVGR